MIGFWIAAGLLLTGALLFVVPPLLASRRRSSATTSHDDANVAIYRDQLKELDNDLEAGTITPEQHAQSRREIEKRLLEEVGAPDAAPVKPGMGQRSAAIVVGLALPLLSLGLYVVLGNPRGLDPQEATSSAQGASHSITPEQIAGMVEKLHERLKENPDDAEGWVMLARSYNVLQRYPEAAQAYAAAVKRLPDNAQLLTDYADTLAMAQNRRLEGEPERLIQQALTLEPTNVKALMLAGTVAFEKRDYAEAARVWQNILGLVPEDSATAVAVNRSIGEARRLAAENAAPASGAPAASAAAAPGGAPASPQRAPAAARGKLTGTVKLAPEVAAKASPGDTVFVFARAVDGPRVPLAIQRRSVKDLPFDFTLDDTMSMAPNLKLSGVERVIVGARISRTGDAIAKPGDLEGLSGPVKVGTTGLTITVDAEVK